MCTWKKYHYDKTTQVNNANNFPAVEDLYDVF